MNSDPTDHLAVPTTDYIETQTGSDCAAEAVCTVIWLHGLGADGNDFVPLVPALQIPKQTPVRFIFPHAPVRPITINGNLAMRGWYDITQQDFAHDQDRIGIEQSATILREIIEQENRRQPSQNIFLAGFSQGGAMALHIGLRHPQPLAGIIALSAYLPLASSLDAERAAANHHTPIFIAHGQDDPIIPIHLAHTSKQQLQQAGYSVYWHAYPMQHTVAPQEIADIADFLKTHMPVK